MGTRPKSEPGDEFLTPQERAKKYSTGSFTATETGARAEANRHEMNQTKMNGGQLAPFMEDVISGKKKLP